MRFIYHPLASQESLCIDGDKFHHLFRTRRTGDKNTSSLFLRNLQDEYLYEYAIMEVKKKEAMLSLTTKVQDEVSEASAKFLHIGWCMIDPKEIEKSLSFLNEIGVGKISFIYCQKSQKNFTPNLERLQKILTNSCEQCGRTTLMQLEVLPNLQEFKERYEGARMLHFCDNTDVRDISTLLIGAEGGWSEEEVRLYQDGLVGVATPHILRSTTASIVASAQILLSQKH